MLNTLYELPHQFKKSLWEKLQFTGSYAPIIAIYIIGLPLLSLARISLMLWQSERVISAQVISQMVVQGLRVDLILLGLMALIPLLLSPLFIIFKAWKPWKFFTYIWLISAITLIIFLEMATPGFIVEYGTRPNRLFIEYLKYPQEILPMLWNGFRIHVLVVLVMVTITILFMVRLISPWLKLGNTLPNLRYWVALPLVVLLMVLSIRSTIGHRPANPALFAMTNDSMVNSLILNSTYSVFYAIYNLKHEGQSSKIYGGNVDR